MPVLRTITEISAKAMGVERVGVWFFSEKYRLITCEDLFLSSKKCHEKGLRLATGRYPRYFNALENSRFIDAADALADKRTGELASDYLAPAEIKSLLNIPVRLNGRLIGVLCIETVGVVKQWTNEEINFASSLADLLSLALQTVRHEQARETLRVREEQLNTITDNMMDMIRQTDTEGVVGYASPSHEKICGFCQNALIGNSIYDYIIPADREKVMASVQKLIKNGRSGRMEYRLRHAKGYYIWVESITNPIFDHEGRVKGFISCVRDIAERKKAEKSMQLTVVKLKKAMEGVIEAMGLLVEKRDMYTANHQRRVAEIASKIAKQNGVT